MNVTFMIGNGFDMNLGLETSYASFLKWYLQNDCSLNCEKVCDSKCDNYITKVFKNDIVNEQQFWSYAELAFGKYTENYTADNIEKFCDCHEDFCVNLAEYLKNEQDKLTEEIMPADAKGKFYKSLLHCHRHLREVDRQQIIEAIKNLDEYITFNFINFNYTDSLTKIINAGTVKSEASSLRARSKGLLGTVIHVHGTVDKDMVLGLNDESQIKNMSIFEDASPEYLEQIIKIKSNIAYAENTDIKAHDILKSSVFIYIYGMSIGDTDAIWWSRICELMSTKNHIHVIIHAFDAPNDNLLMRRFNTYKNHLISKFLSYSDLSDDVKKNIKSRIHIDNKNIFEDLNNITKDSSNTDEKVNVDIEQKSVTV